MLKKGYRANALSLQFTNSSFGRLFRIKLLENNKPPELWAYYN